MTTQQVIKPITLATLKDATAQEVFDQVVNHLRIQGERAYNEDVQSCQYRITKEDGTVLKCAAGCLIGDEEYTEDMDNSDEGTTWIQLVEDGKVPHYHQDLISSLQTVHDNYDDSEWEEPLSWYARYYNLKYTPAH